MTNSRREGDHLLDIYSCKESVLNQSSADTITYTAYKDYIGKIPKGRTSQIHTPTFKDWAFNLSRYIHENITRIIYRYFTLKHYTYLNC